jgi:hypothetical protein
MTETNENDITIKITTYYSAKTALKQSTGIEMAWLLESVNEKSKLELCVCVTHLVTSVTSI